MNPHSFFIHSTSKEEILQIINSLQQGKASGPNSIPDVILQLIKFEIAGPIADN